MYKVIGLNGKEMRAESFTEALKILYGLFPESFAQGKIPQSCEKACYIEGGALRFLSMWASGAGLKGIRPSGQGSD